MLARKSRCFEFYITKKSVFAFSSLKHARLSFIAQKACFGLSAIILGCFRCYYSFIAQKACFGLFAIILGCFRCYCTKKWFSSSMLGVTLIFTSFYLNNGFPFFWLLHCLRIVFLRTNLFSVSITKLHFGRSMLPKKCFNLLATELGYLKPYATKKSVSFFLCLKYAAFSHIAGKTCFGLCSVKNWAVSSVIAPEKMFRFGLLAT